MNQFVKAIVILNVLTVYLFGFQATILAEGDGYGENPGGAGGDTIVVATKEDLKTYAGSGKPYVILIKDTINVGSELRVTSFKTISGMDSNSTIIGAIAIKSGTNNVVVKNLNISNPLQDGITIRNAQYIFVTNCTVYDCADGCIDITVESDFVTVSHCRFYYENVTFHKFVNLIGSSDDNITDRGKLHVTMHHNWWDRGCTSRMPRVRFGYVHIYNNYYSCTNNNYASRAGLEGHIYSEYNYFDGVRDPLTVEGGWAKSVGNEYVNCEGTIYAGTDNVFTPSYNYTTGIPAEAKDSIVVKSGNINQKKVPDDGKKETFISWSDQGAIIFGTALSESHLDASATGNTSAAVYSHPVGTMLPEGYQTITVTFPEDEHYRAASKTVNIKVNYEYYSLSTNIVNGTDADLLKVSPEGKMINNNLYYPKGTVVTVSASSNFLSGFDHWQNGETSDSLTITMNENTEVSAYYETLNYVVAWDLYEIGNKDRKPDFFSADENQSAILELTNESGSSLSWSQFSESNELLGKNAAMIRRGGSSAGNYYFQIRFDATNFKNLKVRTGMLGMNTFYQIQNVEYSVDGVVFDKVGEFKLEQDSTWYSGTFPLPENANGRSSVFVRFKADKSSLLSSGGIIGTSIGEIMVLADYSNSISVEHANANLKVVEKRYYTMEGKQLEMPKNGINIVLIRYQDGSTSVEKLLIDK